MSAKTGNVEEERESFQLGGLEYAMFALLFFVLPFGLEIRTLELGRYESILLSFGYWTVFSSQGITVELPYWSNISAFWVFLYYMGMQLVFVYALKKHYDGKVSRKSTLIFGVVSTFPGLLPFVTGALIIFVIQGPPYFIALFLTFSLPALFGLWILKSKPSPIHTTWVDESQSEQW
ncbi:MAG: hypothetical protein P1Q69_00720 [Candidatus Thorarchaeota archaeon]|nr:hypothetical protein [Candidatus Thorarchaeota archaeon]